MVKRLKCCFSNINALLCKIFALFLIFSFARILFVIYNFGFFSDVGFFNAVSACLIGLRVDWCLIMLINAPTVILYTFPIKNIKFVIFFANIWFFFVNSVAVLLNLFDIKYFPFTFRRLGGEIFGQAQLFIESAGIYRSVLLLYWHLILIGILLLCVLWKLAFNVSPKCDEKDGYSWKKNCIIFLFFCAMIALGVRGGFQRKPFKTVDLPAFCNSNQVQLIANNPCLNIIQTRKKSFVPSFKFFDEKSKLDKIFSPIHRHKLSHKTHGMFAGKNIVIIILESFTSQNVGFLDREYKDHPMRTFTPFLDDLLAKSMYFDGFANGTISIDALTAVLESIPALFESAFVRSVFSQNLTHTLASSLRKQGYSTLFFYGGKKNSCNFDTARAHAGIENYLNRDDFFKKYPNKVQDDANGTWGIHDDEWLQFTLEYLEEVKSPFFATIFTLSSHHPFELQKKYNGMFPTGEHPLQEITAYSDFALRQFFENARNKKWYEDTLFILVADHISGATERYYQKNLGGYSIPLAIFDPSGKLCGKNNRIAQQIDIMPTIFDLVGYDQPYFSFGSSLFDDAAMRFAVSYKNGLYQIITQKFVLQFDGQKSIGFYDRSDFLLEKNLINCVEFKEDLEGLEKFLKSFLQQYGESLRTNKMTCDVQLIDK